MKWIIIALLAVVALAISPWAIAMGYMQIEGHVVEGKVIAKREAILLPGGDSWDHVFEITYSYRPLGSTYTETATHRVDSTLYRRMQVGSIARIRYSPLRMPRSVVGMGSFLEGSSLLSRLGLDLFTARSLIVISIVSVGLLTALFAYRKKSGRLGLLAAWIVAMPAPVLFLAITAFIAFPGLFLACRSSKKVGYGLLLLGSIPFSAVVVYLQIPQPTQIPADLQRHAMATVRQVHVVNEIWTDYGKSAEDAGGQGIRKPFQIVDLEFRPDGASDSVHALDRLDMNSAPGLREGATVQIAYSLADPNIAFIYGGTRNYPRVTLMYLLGLTYGIAGILAFVLLPGLALMDRFFHSLTKLLPVRASGEDPQLISRVPANHPQRETIEKVLRALQKQGRRDTAEHQ
jgi:hypothetical protein